jgi:hypothetical protein
LNPAKYGRAVAEPSPRGICWAASDILKLELARMKDKAKEKGGLNDLERKYILDVFVSMQRLAKTRVEVQTKKEKFKREAQKSGSNNLPVGSPVGIVDDPGNLASDALVRMQRLQGADGILTGSSSLES